MNFGAAKRQGGIDETAAAPPPVVTHPPKAAPAAPAEAIFRKSRLVWFSCDIYSFLVAVTNTVQWSDVANIVSVSFRGMYYTIYLFNAWQKKMIA